MSKTLLSSIVVATLAFAAPALAASREGETGNGVTSVGATTVAAPAQRELRYCVISDSTETRIQRKICKTRKEWLADGFDPLNK